MTVHQYHFTETVRQSLHAARLEALRLGCNYVGTEHMLLGMLRESTDVTHLLEMAGTDVAEVRREAERRGARGPAVQASDASVELPYTSAAKRVLGNALAEAERHEAPALDCQHLLLGLAIERKGIAAQALAEHGAGLDRLRSLTGMPEATPRGWFARWRR